MKQTALIIAFLLSTHLSFGQEAPKEYFDLVKIADSLYNSKDFKKSAILLDIFEKCMIFYS